MRELCLTFKVSNAASFLKVFLIFPNGYDAFLDHLLPTSVTYLSLVVVGKLSFTYSLN